MTKFERIALCLLVCSSSATAVALAGGALCAKRGSVYIQDALLCLYRMPPPISVNRWCTDVHITPPQVDSIEGIFVKSAYL